MRLQKVWKVILDSTASMKEVNVFYHPQSSCPTLLISITNHSRQPMMMVIKLSAVILKGNKEIQVESKISLLASKIVMF